MNTLTDFFSAPAQSMVTYLFLAAFAVAVVAIVKRCIGIWGLALLLGGAAGAIGWPANLLSFPWAFLSMTAGFFSALGVTIFEFEMMKRTKTEEPKKTSE